MRDLCAEKDSTPKQGYHDQTGMLMMAGPGIRVGANADACTTLDLAPTLLTILGIPVPSHMKGRVLDELLEPSVRSYRASVSESPAAAPAGV
jgi:arylsulfatase A-like enzyme